MRLRPAVLAELGQLLRLAECLQRRLRLRIHRDQVPPRVGDTEDRVINLEADHRLDEIELLRKRVVFDLHVLGLQVRLVVGDHRVVNGEVRLDRGAAGGLLRDARVAFRRVLLRVVGER